MTGRKPPTKSQRQTLMSNFTSQRSNETRDTILAHDTQPSQQGKQNFASTKFSQPVPCSQVNSVSESDEDISPKSKRPFLNNSMRAFRAIIDGDSDEDDASLVKDTPCFQIPTKSNTSLPDDVVYDSQEEKSDQGMDLNDVHSQMSFQPPYTSTQRELQDNIVANNVPNDRKRKKTSALSDRPVKKSLSKITKTFDISCTGSKDYVRGLPSKRPKSGDSPNNAILWELEGPSSSTNYTEPQTRRKTAKLSEGKSGSQRTVYKDVDISQVSSGKSYDVEEPDSFLHQRHNRTSMFSINDISRVVENMKDMVETMKIRRTAAIPVLPFVPNESNMSNVKKFRKAPQGRYNPSLQCKRNVIGNEDFKDFRTF